MSKKISLCNFCDFDISKCTWMQDFTPVEGWKAKPTVITSNAVENQQSFHVIKCPLFRPFPKRTIHKESVKVRCVETGKVYNSYEEAAKDVGLSKTNGIRGCANKFKYFKTAAGFHWELI